MLLKINSQLLKSQRKKSQAEIWAEAGILEVSEMANSSDGGGGDGKGTDEDDGWKKTGLKKNYKAQSS